MTWIFVLTLVCFFTTFITGVVWLAVTEPCEGKIACHKRLLPLWRVALRIEFTLMGPELVYLTPDLWIKGQRIASVIAFLLGAAILVAIVVKAWKAFIPRRQTQVA